MRPSLSTKKHKCRCTQPLPKLKTHLNIHIPYIGLNIHQENVTYSSVPFFIVRFNVEQCDVWSEMVLTQNTRYMRSTKFTFDREREREMLGISFTKEHKLWNCVFVSWMFVRQVLRMLWLLWIWGVCNVFGQPKHIVIATHTDKRAPTMKVKGEWINNNI